MTPSLSKSDFISKYPQPDIVRNIQLNEHHHILQSQAVKHPFSTEIVAFGFISRPTGRNLKWNQAILRQTAQTEMERAQSTYVDREREGERERYVNQLKLWRFVHMSLLTY